MEQVPRIIRLFKHFHCEGIVICYTDQTVIAVLLQDIRPQSIAVSLESWDYFNTTLYHHPAFFSAKNILLRKCENVDLAFLSEVQERVYLSVVSLESLDRLLQVGRTCLL